MSVEEILLDTEDRMEKALAKLKQDLAGIRTGRANPGLVDSLAGGSLWLAHADQGDRLGRRARAHADRHSPLRSRHVEGHRKGRAGQRPGTEPAERRTSDSHQRAAAVDGSAPQARGPHSSELTEEDQGRRSQCSPRRKQERPTRNKKTKSLTEDDRDQVKEDDARAD